MFFFNGFAVKEFISDYCIHRNDCFLSALSCVLSFGSVIQYALKTFLLSAWFVVPLFQIPMQQVLGQPSANTFQQCYVAFHVASRMVNWQDSRACTVILLCHLMLYISQLTLMKLRKKSDMILAEPNLVFYRKLGKMSQY